MVRRLLTLLSIAIVALPTVSGMAQGNSDDDVILVPEDTEVIEVPEEDDVHLVPDDVVEADNEEEEEGADSETDSAVEVGPILIEAPLQDLGTVGGSATRIGSDELERLEHDDPHSILSAVPGLTFRQEDAFGLRPNIGLRGANSDRSKKVTLMEDGVLFGPAPYAAPAAYYFPLMTRMTGIEVFKGPGAIIYGPNTIGGSINFLSRPIPLQLSGASDLAFGSYLSAKGHVWAGGSNGWGGFLLEGVRLQSDGFKELDGGGETGFSKSEFVAKGRLNTDLSAAAYHELELRLGYSTERSNETYLGLSDSDYRENPYRRYLGSERDEMKWDRTQIQLRYFFEAGEALEASVIAYRHDFRRGWFKLNGFVGGPSIGAIVADPDSGSRQVYFDVLTGAEDSTEEETLGIGLNDRTFVSQGIQGTTRWRTGGVRWSNTLEVGARLHMDSIERRHTQDGFWVEAGALIPADGFETQITTRNRGEALSLAVHTIDQVGLWRLTLAPGIRVEMIGTSLDPQDGSPALINNSVVILPGLGAHYAITPTFGVLAGVHRGFSPVSPGQPDDVEPEFATNYEGGLRYLDKDSGTHAEAIGFYSDYENLTGECSFSSGCAAEDLDQQFNAGRATIYGVELSASAVASAGGFHFPVRLTYTFTHAEFDGDFSSDNPQFGRVVSGDRMPYVPVQQLSAGLGVEQERWGLNLAGTYVDEMLEEAGHPEDDGIQTTDRQILVDAKIHATFWRNRLTAYAKADNLTGATPIVSRRPFGARPARPFLAQLGLKLAW
jgi:Fe(3+) dicitrate transport protein